jgi:hypothetical protein
MVRSGRPDGTDAQQSLGELVAQAAKDMSSLVRHEMSLSWMRGGWGSPPCSVWRACS